MTHCCSMNHCQNCGACVPEPFFKCDRCAGNAAQPTVSKNGYSLFNFPTKKKSQEEIAEFSKWLKENEPVLKDEDYWELFAYRICDYLKV